VSLHNQLVVVPVYSYNGIDYSGAVLRHVRFASSKSNYLPATNITQLPTSGMAVLVSRDSERIRGDVWVMEKTYLLMP
jgi:hypothetical protein